MEECTQTCVASFSSPPSLSLEERLTLDGKRTCADSPCGPAARNKFDDGRDFYICVDMEQSCLSEPVRSGGERKMVETSCMCNVCVVLSHNLSPTISVLNSSAS